MSKDKNKQKGQKGIAKESDLKEEPKIKVKLIAPVNMVGVLQLHEKQYLNGEIAELTEKELQTLKYGSSWKYEEVK